VLGSSNDGLARSDAETATQEGEIHHGHHHWLPIDGARRNQHGVLEPGRVLRDTQSLSIIAGVGETQRIAHRRRRCQRLGRPGIQQHPHALSG
jgi:hypothetical protein